MQRPERQNLFGGCDRMDKQLVSIRVLGRFLLAGADNDASADKPVRGNERGMLFERICFGEGGVQQLQWRVDLPKRQMSIAVNANAGSNLCL